MEPSYPEPTEMEPNLSEVRSKYKALNKLLKSLEPPAEPPRYDFEVDVWAEYTTFMKTDEREWLLDGLEHGFDIYVKDELDLSRDAVKNLPTDLTRKVATVEWIYKNIGLDAIWGPFKSMSELPSWLMGKLRVSPIGAIKKGLHLWIPNHLKEWRVIHHLSHPRSGPSVNSEVIDEWATVQYVQFREVVQMVHSLGKGALLWTVDAKDAYLRVPIKQRAMKHMGFKWDKLIYVFTCLSFGLASAPRIYTLFADAVLEIIKHHTGSSEWWKCDEQPLIFHYIDDFFGGAPIGADFSSMQQFRAVISWFDKLGIPTKPSKCCEPNTSTKILGFVYDTIEQMVFIPIKKQKAIEHEIKLILKAKEVTKESVLSIIGKLRWASVCIFAGPAFVRRLEFFANSVDELSHHIKTKLIKSDLIWWQKQLSTAAEGVRFVDILRKRANGDVHVYTDASTGDGMGGWNREGQWFRFGWSQHERKELFPNPKQPDIYWKEMVAIAAAALIWGEQWRGKAVTFWIDNSACVWSLIKRRCDFKREDVMQLIRMIASCANIYGFQPYFIHIAGKDNLTADALSRFDVEKFKKDTAGIEMAASATQCKWALDAALDRAFPTGDPWNHELRDLLSSI